jgi:hypothetical protein
MRASGGRSTEPLRVQSLSPSSAAGATANRQLRSQIEQREIAEAEVQKFATLEAIGQITSGTARDFNNLLSDELTNARLLSHNLYANPKIRRCRADPHLCRTGCDLLAQVLALSLKRLEPQEFDLNGKVVELSDLLGATLGGTVQLGRRWPPIFGLPWSIHPNEGASRQGRLECTAIMHLRR